MKHADHVELLRHGVPGPGGVWADFGSGAGAFALALAELIGPSGEIYAVDTDTSALREQERSMRARSEGLRVHYLAADFTRPLDGALPPLDGAVMANALHFVAEDARGAVVRSIRRCLRSGGRFILVEYNVDRGNLWVPHPLSYHTWEAVAQRAGFTDTRLLSTRPSRFLREIYSALSINPAAPA